MNNTCPGHTPTPTRAEIEATDPAWIYQIVYELNILSNAIFCVPALALYVLGFPGEATVLLVLAMLSTMWHATGQHAWGALDVIFAGMAFVVMLLVLLRVVQVRGWPLFAAYYLTLPLLGLLAFGAIRTDAGPAEFVRDRICHTLWHVLVAAGFLFITLEVARTPALLPNRAAAAYTRGRDATAERYGRTHESPAPPSLVYGFFRDLVRWGAKPPKGTTDTKRTR